jgi:hypothetical protein
MFERDGKKYDPWFHRCGIMMGEGLSGIFLNGMSMFVRSSISVFADTFEDLYYGSSEEDADEFISDASVLIQDFLDTVQPKIFYDQNSSQSGDDAILFSETSYRTWLILLYRVLGFKPSKTVFHSSEWFGTFTEETCLKTPCSNGWRFIDSWKPRLARPSERSDGIRGLLSRIGQITNRLRYTRVPVEISRACAIVDHMIESNKVLRDRTERYGIIPGLPDWLGGYSHPECLDEDFLFDLPCDVVRALSYLETAPIEDLFRARFSYLFDRVEDEDDVIKENLMILFNIVDSLDVVKERAFLPDDEDFFAASKSVFLDKGQFGYLTWSRAVDTLATAEGFTTFTAFATRVSAGLKLQQMLNSKAIPSELHPCVVLRNRFERILKLPPEDFVSTGVACDSLKRIKWRLNHLDQKYFRPKMVGALLPCGSLPSLSIRFRP